MKDLYNVIESILDDQEDIVDKATDNVIEVQKKIVDQILKYSLQDANVGNTTYDKKNKVIKLYMLMLHLHNNEVCIHLRPLRGKSSAKNIYIPINLATGMGIKFDGSLCISAECINTGFKLSQVNIVGSGHKLYIKDSGETLTSAQLDRFLDCSTKCFDVLLDYNSSIAGFKSTSKFKVTQTAVNWSSHGSTDHDIVGCGSDVLYVLNCSVCCPYFNSKYKNSKTFSDVLEREASDNTFDELYTHFCKSLIESNPRCKIIVDLYSRNPTHVWLDNDGKVKHRELSVEKLWNQI